MHLLHLLTDFEHPAQLQYQTCVKMWTLRTPFVKCLVSSACDLLLILYFLNSTKMSKNAAVKVGSVCDLTLNQGCFQGSTTSRPRWVEPDLWNWWQIPLRISLLGKFHLGDDLCIFASVFQIHPGGDVWELSESCSRLPGTYRLLNADYENVSSNQVYLN